MTRLLPLAALVLLAACGEKTQSPVVPERRTAFEPGDVAAQLAAAPKELADLRRRCRADRAAVGADTCEAVARATRMRFMNEGPSAYAPGVVSGTTGNAAAER